MFALVSSSPRELSKSLALTSIRPLEQKLLAHHNCKAVRASYPVFCVSHPGFQPINSKICFACSECPRAAALTMVKAMRTTTKRIKKTTTTTTTTTTTKTKCRHLQLRLHQKNKKEMMVLQTMEISCCLVEFLSKRHEYAF